MDFMEAYKMPTADQYLNEDDDIEFNDYQEYENYEEPNDFYNQSDNNLETIKEYSHESSQMLTQHREDSSVSQIQSLPEDQQSQLYDSMNMEGLKTFTQIMKMKKIKQAIFEEEYQKLLYLNQDKLIKQYQLQKIRKKLQNDNLSEENLAQIIQNQQLQRPQTSQSIQSSKIQQGKPPIKRDKDFEELKAEIIEVKKINNLQTEKIRHQETQIRTLEEKLLKYKNNQESFMVSTVSTKSSSSLQQEDLIQQNLILKKELNLLKDNYNRKANRNQKIEDALAEERAKLSSQKLSKAPSEVQDKSTELRLKIQKQQEQIEKLNQEIKERDLKLKEIYEKLDKKSKQVTDAEILSLQNQIDQKNKIISEFDHKIQQKEEELALDVQIKKILPNQYKNLEIIMNALYQIEKNNQIKFKLKHILSYIQKYGAPIVNCIKELISKIFYSFKFKITKKLVDHPDNQEIIKKAVQLIRNNPTTLEKLNQLQAKELQNLNEVILDLGKQIMEQQKIIQLKTADISELRNHMILIEEQMHMDKIEFSKNLMMQLMKKENEGMKVDLINQIKEYCNLMVEDINSYTNKKEKEKLKKKQDQEKKDEKKGNEKSKEKQKEKSKEKKQMSKKQETMKQDIKLNERKKENKLIK